MMRFHNSGFGAETDIVFDAEEQVGISALVMTTDLSISYTLTVTTWPDGPTNPPLVFTSTHSLSGTHVETCARYPFTAEYINTAGTMIPGDGFVFPREGRWQNTQLTNNDGARRFTPGIGGRSFTTVGNFAQGWEDAVSIDVTRTKFPTDGGADDSLTASYGREWIGQILLELYRWVPEGLTFGANIGFPAPMLPYAAVLGILIPTFNFPDSPYGVSPTGYVYPNDPISWSGLGSYSWTGTGVQPDDIYEYDEGGVDYFRTTVYTDFSASLVFGITGS